MNHKTLEQIAPWRARAQHPKDAVQHTAIIETWDASRLVRNRRINHRPFEVSQIISAYVDAESNFDRRRKRIVELGQYEAWRDTVPASECGFQTTWGVRW